MAEAEEFHLKVPPNLEKYFKADSPRDARVMAAKGLVPMPPPLMASAMATFLDDPDPEIKKAAEDGLAGMPANLVLRIAKEEVHPRALEAFARTHVNSDEILEPILLNRLTPDDTFVMVAGKCSESIATLLGNNQVRLLRMPKIAEALKKNPKALKSELDRISSFLRMNGIVLEGETPELTSAEIRAIMDTPDVMGESVDIPPELLVESAPGEDAAVKEEKKLTLYQAVQTMKIAQKIKLALKGNKEARSLLIKDSNKIVATAVVKSPKITEGEVISIAQMRTIQDEVIRIISNNPEWMRNYNLQVALANNPKTPFPIGLKLVRQLRTPDLEKAAKNKNIPQQLSKIAKDLFEQKRK